MKYTRLGRSGLDVSRVCLGCMGFGEGSPGRQDWAVGEAESREMIAAALDLGINFFDTANAYSAGSSEEIVGRALRDMADRDNVVIEARREEAEAAAALAAPSADAMGDDMVGGDGFGQPFADDER